MIYKCKSQWNHRKNWNRIYLKKSLSNDGEKSLRMKASRLEGERPFLIPPPASPLFNEFPKAPQRERPTAKIHSTLHPTGAWTGAYWAKRIRLWAPKYFNDTFIHRCIIVGTCRRLGKAPFLIIKPEPSCSFSLRNQPLKVCKSGRT